MKQVMLRRLPVERRENGHNTEVVTLMEGECSYCRGGHFNGGRMVMLGGQFNGRRIVMLWGRSL